MDDLGYEGRGQRILELERELAEARYQYRVAVDNHTTELLRLREVAGELAETRQQRDAAEQGILECQTREISLRRLVMIAACNLRESGRGDVADMILAEPIMQETA